MSSAPPQRKLPTKNPGVEKPGGFFETKSCIKRKSDNRQSGAYVHLRDVHIKTKKMWPCLQCGKTLSSAYNLKQHVKYLHAKFPRERNEIVTYYTCDQCTSYFVSRSSKRRHIRTMHERRGHHQPVERNVEQDAETVAKKKKTFYRCPFKTEEEGNACDFDLSKDDIKWENSAMAVDHIQMYHFEQAKQETRIKWIKITT